MGAILLRFGEYWLAAACPRLKVSSSLWMRCRHIRFFPISSIAWYWSCTCWPARWWRGVRRSDLPISAASTGSSSQLGQSKNAGKDKYTSSSCRLSWCSLRCRSECPTCTALHHHMLSLHHTHAQPCSALRSQTTSKSRAQAGRRPQNPVAAVGNYPISPCTCVCSLVRGVPSPLHKLFPPWTPSCSRASSWPLWCSPRCASTWFARSSQGSALPASRMAAAAFLRRSGCQSRTASCRLLCKWGSPEVHHALISPIFSTPLTGTC